jgi:hypothetical protein
LPDSGDVNPIPALRLFQLGPSDDIFQHAAVLLDRPDRTNVVLVAGDQDAVDANLATLDVAGSILVSRSNLRTRLQAKATLVASSAKVGRVVAESRAMRYHSPASRSERCLRTSVGRPARMRTV